MSKPPSISALMIVLLGLTVAWGQDSPGPPPPDGSPDTMQPQQPAPAYGPDNAAPPVSENPPISGLDLPNLQPHAAPLSYLQPGAHVSESVDSNIENSLGGSEARSLTRAEGSLDLERLWSHYDLSLDYLGGVGNYDVHGIGIRQIEELGLYQKVSWKRGELGIRDAFSYLPEGNFGSSYGSAASQGAGLGGAGVFYGGSALGALGQVPRIINLSLLDAVETLTPKSSITATVGYGFVHFLQNDPGTGNPFIGGSQISGELGYSRILGPHDQGALVYGYQGFTFSTGETLHSNVMQLLWGHRISGRMDFLVAGGPEFIKLDNELSPVTNLTSADIFPPCVLEANLTVECPSNRLIISAAGRSRLRYQFSKAALDASYEHYVTSGSGFFAGAKTDIVHLSLGRPLNRVWRIHGDIGYARSSRLTPQPCSSSTKGCPGVAGSTYQTAFAGLGVDRNFGRNFHAFATYQFNELVLDSSFCGQTGTCNRISNREVGTIGLDWAPRPIRLD